MFWTTIFWYFRRWRCAYLRYFCLCHATGWSSSSIRWVASWCCGCWTRRIRRSSMNHRRRKRNITTSSKKYILSAEASLKTGKHFTLIYLFPTPLWVYLDWSTISVCNRLKIAILLLFVSNLCFNLIRYHIFIFKWSISFWLTNAYPLKSESQCKTLNLLRKFTRHVVWKVLKCLIFLS